MGAIGSANRAVIPAPQIHGRVGFFWIVVDREGNDLVLAETQPLDAAEMYGDALTHPGGHYEHWEAMRKAPGVTGFSACAPYLLVSEYDEWPRGRVVFHTDRMRFSLYLDRRLNTPTRLKLLQDAFNLPMQFVNVRYDEHYTKNDPN